MEGKTRAHASGEPGPEAAGEGAGETAGRAASPGEVAGPGEGEPASVPERRSGASVSPGGPGASATRARRGASVSPAELERVFRRASDLQFRSGSPDAEGTLDEAELLRIGQEVGLEPRYVRQALAEVRADSLLPALPEESRLASRAWGTAIVRASRVVPGDPAEVEAEIEEHFRDRELLKRVRSQPGRSLWETAGGLIASMRRAMDVGGHGYELAKARSVEVFVEPLEPGRSLVTLTADLRNLRTELASAYHAVLLGLAVPLSVFLVATGGAELPILVGSGAAGTTAVGAATWATNAHFRRRRKRAELILEGLLDRLELGEPLSNPTERWRERFLR